MVYVQRLIIACMLFLGLSLCAHAENVRISGLFNSPTGTTSYSDGQSYCMSASLGAGRTPTGYIGIGSDKSTIVCSFLNVDGTPSQMGVKHYCLKGGQADTAQFGCYGEKPANACKAAGTNYFELREGEDVQVGTKGLLCLEGCQMKAPGTVACVQVLNRWSCYAGGPGWITYTGSECTGNEGELPTTGNDPLPTDCKAGTCPGTINGNAVCVPCESGIDDGEGSGGEGSGGSGEGEGGTGSGTGTGEGEGGGSGTGGTGTGTGGGNGDDNGSGDWGGDCKKGFVCEGDALICAISQAEHKRNCELLENPKESDEHKAYIDALAAANRAAESGEGILSDLTEEVDISNGRINTSSAIGSGSCLKDVRVDVLGKSIVLPLSDLCPYLAALGNVLMAISFLLAARIILRG